MRRTREIFRSPGTIISAAALGLVACTSSIESTRNTADQPTTASSISIPEPCGDLQSFEVFDTRGTHSLHDVAAAINTGPTCVTVYNEANQPIGDLAAGLGSFGIECDPMMTPNALAVRHYSFEGRGIVFLGNTLLNQSKDDYAQVPACTDLPELVSEPVS